MIKKRFKKLIFSDSNFDVTKRLEWNQDSGDGYLIPRGGDIGFSIGDESDVIDNVRFNKSMRKAENIIQTQMLIKSKNIDDFLVNASNFKKLSAKKKEEDN